MAASANPSADNNQNEGGVSTGNGGTGNSIPVPNNSRIGPTEAALKHSPGLSHHWTPDEQNLLQDLLLKYASDSAIIRYAKISVQLQDKTVRDVALRCRHMNKKENGKRRKEDHSSLKKNKDKREKVADPSAKSSSHLTNRSSGLPYVQTMASVESDDSISYKAIGGATGQLLEQNAQAMDQISANFGAFKIHDNINLLCQARNNILSILNDLNINDLPEIMKQMPPLPVKINEEIAGSILPPSLHTKS